MTERWPPELRALYVGTATLFGLVFGSFLNVCIYRIPRDLSVITPRSFCPECGVGIAWYENIPLFSYVALKGRCSKCAKRIGFRYPVVEATTGMVFGLVVLLYGWGWAALKWGIFESLVIALFWMDIEERLLPDELTLGGCVAGLMLGAFVRVPGGLVEIFLPGLRAMWQSLSNAGLGAVVLAGPIWMLSFVYARLRGREGLGLGDVKLLAMLGIFLGVENGLLALLVGTIGGSVLGLLYIWLGRKKASSYELPFGSFLCAGAAAVPLFHRL